MNYNCAVQNKQNNDDVIIIERFALHRFPLCVGFVILVTLYNFAVGKLLVLN